MKLTADRRRQKFLFELRDMLAGAAFPLMLQLIFSASIILFVSYDDAAIQLSSIIVGEILLIAAYFIFGRQSGITGYRRTVQYEKKRASLETDDNFFNINNASDQKAVYGTGEYALYKGFLIGLISTVPFIIFQFIQCVAPNTVCEFVLKYAFGWAFYPFYLIGKIPSVGELPGWLNYIWVIVAVAIHGAAYFWGGKTEKVRQQKVAEAQELKGKRRR